MDEDTSVPCLQWPAMQVNAQGRETAKVSRIKLRTEGASLERQVFPGFGSRIAKCLSFTDLVGEFIRAFFIYICYRHILQSSIICYCDTERFIY